MYNKYIVYHKYHTHLLIWCFFLYFNDYLHCRLSLKTSKLWMNTLCSKQKVWNNSKHVLHFRFFKIATLCFDYCFAHCWLSLDELHEVVIWNGFSTVLKEFLEMLSTCWPFCLHSAVHLIPKHSIGFRSGDCGGQVIWRSTPSLSFLVK